MDAQSANDTIAPNVKSVGDRVVKTEPSVEGTILPGRSGMPALGASPPDPGS